MSSAYIRLERVSLIPRAGRRKTQRARATEVEEASGQFGCLAVDNIYNVYDLTDRKFICISSSDE
jgi:hypothetical protein